MRRRKRLQDYPRWVQAVAGWVTDPYVQTTALALGTLWLLWKLDL